MGKPGAKEGDGIEADDTHIEMVPAGPSLVPTPTPHKFKGKIDGGLSSNVFFEGKAAATVGSTATNTPAHIQKAGNFQKKPADKGTIKKGSEKVKVNGKAAARDGDMAMTCNDPADMPVGAVKASGTVNIG